MSDDDEFDIPQPRDRNDPQLKALQGYGVNPENARRMVTGAGGDKKAQPVEEPTEEDFAAVQKMLEGKGIGQNIAGLWQQFMDYYWSTKERNASASPGKRDDPTKQPSFTPEQTDAYNQDQERRAQMNKDYQRRMTERGNSRKFASSREFDHQGDDLGIEGDRQ